MTPIRKDEKEYLLERMNKLFRNKAQAVESEIQQQAQELADKKKPSFQKLVKVEKKMSSLIEAEKRYKKHMQNKAKEVSEHLSRVSNVRSWSRSFNDYRTNDIDSPASDDFLDDLNRCCYDESLKYVTDNHKLRKVLTDMRDEVEATINSGLSLATAQIEAKKIYNRAGIEYFLPAALTALPTK